MIDDEPSANGQGKVTNAFGLDRRAVGSAGQCVAMPDRKHMHSTGRDENGRPSTSRHRCHRRLGRHDFPRLLDAKVRSSAMINRQISSLVFGIFSMTRSNSCKFTKEGEARSDWVNLDALQSTALRSAMMWLLRKSATLIAVYYGRPPTGAGATPGRLRCLSRSMQQLTGPNSGKSRVLIISFGRYTNAAVALGRGAVIAPAASAARITRTSNSILTRALPRPSFMSVAQLQMRAAILHRFRRVQMRRLVLLAISMPIIQAAEVCFAVVLSSSNAFGHSPQLAAVSGRDQLALHVSRPAQNSPASMLPEGQATSSRWAAVLRYPTTPLRMKSSSSISTVVAKLVGCPRRRSGAPVPFTCI